MAVVRILGIDPGTLVVGFGCVEIGVRPPSGDAPRPLAMRASNAVPAAAATAGPVRLCELGVLRLGGRDAELPARLLELAEQFRALVARLLPQELAIEQAFYGKSVQAALRIGEARGVVLAEAARAGLSVHQFAPARVKRSVAGSGAASKQAVAAMVGQFVSLPGGPSAARLPADATDAVAVALARVEERSAPDWQSLVR